MTTSYWQRDIPTSSYWNRNVPVTDYNLRTGILSNVYDLADVSGVLIQDVLWEQIQILWEYYLQSTQYSLRNTP